MTEIRRIAADEAAAVTELWDEMCRSVVDGSPLSSRGRRNINAMLEAAVDHEDVFCMVAADADDIIAFAVARLSRHPLLPGTAGEIEEFYCQPKARDQGVSRGLANQVVATLRSMGAGTIWRDVCVDDTQAQDFWQHLGFGADAIHLALYAD